MKYFDISEFDCKVTGENRMDPEFLKLIDKLRDRCGFPFVITSGYRSPEHPVELKKPIPGMHTVGIAADIHVNDGLERGKIVSEALKMGFNGVGVAKTFVHVDTRSGPVVVWTYS